MAALTSILLVRMDKIGDLVLALPADRIPELAGVRVTWLVAKGCGFIPNHAEPTRPYIESAKSFSWSNFRQLIARLKALNPDTAVILHAPWWLGLALVCAGVKFRFGRRSQWHSWLFLNRGMRQSRKSGERHESDLNAELVLAASRPPTSSTAADRTQVPPLVLRADSIPAQTWGLTPQGYFVIHPGMAGSALNWPTHRWVELIQTLMRTSRIVITGTAADRLYFEPIRALLGDVPDVTWLTEKLSVNELLAVLAQAKAVVAPSTGVLHLAASLGTATVGLFSPIPVQRPTRWGPRGPRVFTLCPSDLPMEKITVPQVLAGLKELRVL